MPEEDRISRLSKRFKQHAVGRPAATARSRERHSFYLDADLVGQLDQTYRDLSHALYPRNLSKSTFLEALIQYGLNHLDELKSVLADASEDGASSAKS